MSIKNKQSGFTIVELLIVIVVIAILATITFVAYGGIQRSAAEATLKSDLRGASRQLDVAQIEQGSYPDDAYVNEIQASDDTTLEYTSEGETFCLTASSERAGTAFYVTEGNVI
jgi:prepilin-type N-terminal cleavage/methylation domain-containing protein